MLRVLIAGGGVAGLEALLALRDLAGDRVELTLLSPGEEFVYRPMAVAEPFGRGRADRHPLADIAADVRAELIQGALVEVDARQPRRDHRHRAAPVLRRPAGRGRRRQRAGVSPGAHLDAGDRRRAVRRPVARPRRGLPQARGVRRAAGRGVGAARLRAGADDRLAGLGHGPRRRAGDRLHPRGRAAGAVRHAGNRGGAPRPRGGGRAGRDRRVRRRGPAGPPAGSSFTPASGRSTPSESSRCHARSGPDCRGFPPTPAASSPPTCTAESPMSTRSGRPATRSRSRSSRAASPPSRPTRRPSRSPPTPAPIWSPALTDRCSGA